MAIANKDMSEKECRKRKIALLRLHKELDNGYLIFGYNALIQIKIAA